MTSQKMMKTLCGKNKHFWNIAKLGRKPNWVLRDYPLESVDPNESPLLFGYEQREFLLKQYK